MTVMMVDCPMYCGVSKQHTLNAIAVPLLPLPGVVTIKNVFSIARHLLRGRLYQDGGSVHLVLIGALPAAISFPYP